MRFKRLSFVPFLVISCGRTPDGPLLPAMPSPTTPSVELPMGNCHASVSTNPVQVFTPKPLDTSDVPGGGLLAGGGQVYASLLTPDSSGSVAIYVASENAVTTWNPFVTLTASDETGDIFQGRAGIYWPEVLSHGEWLPAEAKLATRNADGDISLVSGTDVNPFVSSAFTVRDDTAFTFYCALNPSSPLPCGSPSDTWKLSATRLSTGETIWTKSLGQTYILAVSLLTT